MAESSWILALSPHEKLALVIAMASMGCTLILF